MKRRDFVKGVGAGGLIAATGLGWVESAFAAQSLAPMGKALGEKETLLVFNAKLVDVANAAIFPETALTIKGGKIEKRLAEQEAAQIASDRKIDARGRHIIPGLINAHCHVSMPGVAAVSVSLISNYREQIDRNCVDCIKHGVTTIRDQAGSQPVIQERVSRISQGELMGPRILRAIGVDVQGGYGFSILSFFQKNAVLAANNAAQARDAVNKALDLGADHIKLFLQYASLFQGEEPLPLMTDDMLAAVVDEAAKRNRTVAVHHTNLDGFRRAVRAGIQSLEHMAIDGPLTDEDIKSFIEGRHTVVPTASVAWALAFPKTGDENFKHPNVQRLYEDKLKRAPSMLQEFAVPPLARLGKYTLNKYAKPGYFDKKHAMITPSARVFNAAGAVGGDNMMLMYKAGCKMGCGNDGGIPFVWPGSLPLEMLLNKEAGMKDADILRNATLINAENIGWGDMLGTLDENKFADVVFLDGNPLENLEYITNIDAVLQSGRLVYTNKRIVEA